MKNKNTNVETNKNVQTDSNTVLVDSKQFVRCLDCEWIVCENHGKCLRDKIS